MTPLTKESLSELLAHHAGPCLSLYQPTHRGHPQNEQDPIRFRNLVKELEVSLSRVYPTTARSLLEPFDALANDRDFWNHTLDGLAVLSAPGLFRVFQLPRPVGELVVVGDIFHIKPLARLLQTVDRYQLLGLSLDEARLFEGDRDGLDEVELAAGVPRTINDALGSQLTESHQTADDADTDTDRFFRAVDRAVLEHHSRPTGLPLILAALPEHHHRFRAVSQNPFLLSESVTLSPDAVTNHELRALAWKALEPHYEARIAKLKNEFEQAKATGLGSDNLPTIRTSAASGRVATLFIGADGSVPGHLDEAITRVGATQSRVDDALDDLGALVDKMGGEVLVLPKARMPTRTGVAAIYRY